MTTAGALSLRSLGYLWAAAEMTRARAATEPYQLVALSPRFAVVHRTIRMTGRAAVTDAKGGRNSREVQRSYKSTRMLGDVQRRPVGQHSTTPYCLFSYPDHF